MKTATAKVLALLALASLLVSCSTAQPEKVSRRPLRIAYSSKWGDYTMIIAQEGGFFSRYGVDVEPVYYDISHDSLADLVSGQLDGGLIVLGDAVNVQSHTPLKVVAVSDDGGFSTILSTPEIKTLADLKGKRIGVQLGTSYELFVSQMLASAGLKESDVTLLNLHPEDVPQFLGTKIDAGYTWEPFTSQALEQGNQVLLSSETVSRLFPNVIAFRQSVVEERPDDIRAFIKAWFAAVEFRERNPEDVRDIVGLQFGLRRWQVPVDEHMRILAKADNYSWFRKQDEPGKVSLFTAATTNADFLIRIGVLTRTPDLNIMLDPSYLQ